MSKFPTIRIIIGTCLMDLNEYTRQERSHMLKGHKARQEQVTNVMWFLPNIKLITPINITFKWFVKNKRKDKDNIAFAQKFILDAMVRKKLIPNDGWGEIGNLDHRFFVDKNERCELYIEQGSNNS